MTSTDEDDLDFSQVPDCAVNEFYRQAEIYLQSTVQIALAADARASTLTGIFGAATVALLVLAANVANKSPIDAPLIASVIVGAVFLIIAAVFCAIAARPVEYFIPGYEPKRLYQAASSERHIKLEAASDMQIRIDRNRKTLRSAAMLLSIGRTLAMAAPITAIATFCLCFRHEAAWVSFLSVVRDHLP